MTNDIDSTPKTGLDRCQIKYIAIAAMIIDHIAMFMLSDGLPDAPWQRIAVYALMRVIGRLTGPIMIFFLVEGFIHTSSRKRYGTRLLAFGLISQIPYALSHYGKLAVLDFNVVITLFLTFLMLTANEKIKDRTLKNMVVFGLIMITWCCDWGVIGPFMAWIFYRNRDDRREQVRLYSAICAIHVISVCFLLEKAGYHWYGELWQAGAFLVIPFLYAYNGEAGKKSPFNKWIFYIIYPLHLLIFWVILYVVR